MGMASEGETACHIKGAVKYFTTYESSLLILIHSVIISYCSHNMCFVLFVVVYIWKWLLL